LPTCCPTGCANEIVFVIVRNPTPGLIGCLRRGAYTLVRKDVPVLALLAISTFDIVLISHFLGDEGPFLDFLLIFEFFEDEIFVLSPDAEVTHFYYYCLGRFLLYESDEISH
jgi:hypothetical protein